MTSRKTRLEQIDESIINEILATPDNEIVQEVGKADIATGRAALQGAEARLGQRRFEAARAQLEASKAVARVVPIISARKDCWRPIPPCEESSRSPHEMLSAAKATMMKVLPMIWRN